MRSYTSNPGNAQPLGNPLEGVEFTLDGEVFRCEGEPDLLDQSELALLAAQGTDIRKPEAQAAIAAFLQMAFGPREYARFRMHTKSHKTDPHVILDIMAGINEELEGFLTESIGRPTVRPSHSSPGGAERAGDLQRVISLGTGDVTIVPPKSGKRTGGKSGTKPRARSGRGAGKQPGAATSLGAVSTSGT